MNRSTYVNAFNFAVSELDCRLNLMVSEPMVDGEGTIQGEEKESVGQFVMPLSLAKDLSTRLSEAINSLERNLEEADRQRGN